MYLKVFFHCACDFYFHLTCLQPYFYMVLMSFPFLAAALITARARISALEAEVKASAQAWENANVAKVSAEKAAKSAENGAKKAEKALADADQKRAKREQSIAERLDKISVAVGSKCHIAPFGYLLRLSLLTCVCLCFVCVYVVQQRKLESHGDFGSPILRIPYWLWWTCWSQTGS
jgi:hypothetical protein